MEKFCEKLVRYRVGPLYLDELGYFKGMQGMRFYRLDELVSLFAEKA